MVTRPYKLNWILHGIWKIIPLYHLLPDRGILLLPGKSHGWRSLVGCSPWGCYESDTTERLHFHFSLSCIGEGSGTPLQCSCLENPRDRGASWAAIYGVAQSQTQLRWLSSSSNSRGIQLELSRKHDNTRRKQILL